MTLAIYSLFIEIRLPARKDIILFLLVSFLFFLNIASSNYGLLSINAGEASFILNLIPLLTSGLAVIILKEELSSRLVMGSVISFIGVSLIALHNSTGTTFNIGIAFLLIAAITFALFQIGQKRLLTQYSPAEVTCFSIWGATVLFLPFGYTLPGSINEATLAGTISAIYLGVFPSSIAYVIWFTALRRIPVSRAAGFFFFSPVFTIIIGYFWLKEIPALVSVGGGVLVIAGVFMVNMKRKT